MAHTFGASRREAAHTHCTTPLSTCERVRCQRHICVSDLPTALREVYLLSPTVLWLLCGCGSPCPNGPKLELFRWYCSGVRGPVSADYTWTNNATRLHFRNKSDAVLFHQ